MCPFFGLLTLLCFAVDQLTKLQTDATFLSYVNDAIAYVNGTTLFGTGVDSLPSDIVTQMDQYVPAGSTDPSVIKGYQNIYGTKAIKQTELSPLKEYPKKT